MPKGPSQNLKYETCSYSTNQCVWSSEKGQFYSSFPKIYKVGNIDIFVQLLTEINWKQLRVSKEICICHNTLN